MAIGLEADRQTNYTTPEDSAWMRCCHLRVSSWEELQANKTQQDRCSLLCVCVLMLKKNKQNRR